MRPWPSPDRQPQTYTHTQGARFKTDKSIKLAQFKSIKLCSEAAFCCLFLRTSLRNCERISLARVTLLRRRHNCRECNLWLLLLFLCHLSSLLKRHKIAHYGIDIRRRVCMFVRRWQTKRKSQHTAQRQRNSAKRTRTHSLKLQWWRLSLLRIHPISWLLQKDCISDAIHNDLIQWLQCFPRKLYDATVLQTCSFMPFSRKVWDSFV